MFEKFSFYDLKDKCIYSLYCDGIGAVGHSEEFNCCRLFDMEEGEYFVDYKQLVDKLTPLSGKLDPELWEVIVKLSEEHVS